SGFFASSLAIIRLNKLTTLSLRLFPPLKPFKRRDHLPDRSKDSLRGFLLSTSRSKSATQTMRKHRGVWGHRPQAGVGGKPTTPSGARQL
ncbi:MAG: hypothetical protein CL920_23870, partial [Deltaproteobacteria bacterium]|nr:hypothetical protein [Deltaproteobacteria bacterium]